MKYELFFGGIVLIGFAYLIYKTFKLSQLTPASQYLITAQKLTGVAMLLMATSADLYLIAKYLVR